MAEPIITDYVKARDCVITIDGSSMRAITANYRRAAEEIDVANIRSGIDAEFTTGIVTTDFNMTIAVSAAEGVPIPDVTESCDISWVTNGGRRHSGKLVITSVSENAGARGLYNYQVTGKTTGPTTNS